MAALLDQESGDAVQAAMAAAQGTLAAPELLDVEVVSAIRRDTMSGRLSDERAAGALRDLLDTGVDLHHHRPLLPRYESCGRT